MVYRKYREIKQWGKTNTKNFKKLLMLHNAEPMPAFEIPAAVKALGITVHDPNDPAFFDNHEGTLPAYTENHPAFRIPTEKDHPLYKPQACLLFESEEPFSDGIDQACHLVKAVNQGPLPTEVVDSSVAGDLLRNTAEDDLVDCILAGERYDPSLERLEPRQDKVLFWVKHPILHGTPVIKKNGVILESLLRKVVLAAVKQGLLTDVRYDRNAPLSAILQTGMFADTPLVVRGQPQVVVQTQKPLGIWADADRVEASRDVEVPNVYPISPFVDLSKSNVYNATALLPRQKISGLHLNTLLISRQQNQMYPWTTEQNAANAIMMCFGAALAQATRSAAAAAGNGVLRQPVVAKTIQLVDGKVDLVGLQLNTLDLSSSDGIKNCVWVEKALPLYKARPYWEDLERVEDANVDTFNKIISLLVRS